ncbi:MAG: RNA polymerase sigma factor RpoH [Saezia sp.]
MNKTKATSLAISNPWAVIPSLGNLDAYISAVNHLPILTDEEEEKFARAFQDKEDIQAAGKLVLSHLRLVVSVARKYLGYGLPHADLIQEGNIGLMKAVKRFNPDHGVRLVSYALHWIKAEIHEYILKNWRMVKVATTKAQRKLFFNLRSMRNDILDEEGGEGAHRMALSPSEVDTIAKQLNVKPEEVLEMEARMTGAEIGLDTPVTDDDESFTPLSYLTDESGEPTQILEVRDQNNLLDVGIEEALKNLDERSRHIVQARWLHVDDDGKGGTTLQELAEEYGVSAERIRQIESAAMKKMRVALQKKYSASY